MADTRKNSLLKMRELFIVRDYLEKNIERIKEKRPPFQEVADQIVNEHPYVKRDDGSEAGLRDCSANNVRAVAKEMGLIWKVKKQYDPEGRRANFMAKQSKRRENDWDAANVMALIQQDRVAIKELDDRLNAANGGMDYLALRIDNANKEDVRLHKKIESLEGKVASCKSDATLLKWACKRLIIELDKVRKEAGMDPLEIHDGSSFHAVVKSVGGREEGDD